MRRQRSADAATGLCRSYSCRQLCRRDAVAMCRYRALQALRLPWISQRRAVALAAAFVRGHPLPSVAELCSSEALLTPKALLRPRVITNASLAELAEAAAALPFAPVATPAAATGNGAPPRHAAALECVLAMYEDEEYLLLPDTAGAHAWTPCMQCRERSGRAGAAKATPGVCCAGGCYLLGVKASCGDRSVSKAHAVLQAVWLQERRAQFPADAAGELAALQASLEYLCAHRAAFGAQLRAAGWQDDNVVMWSRRRSSVLHVA
jgi:hypothetical protein